MIQSVTQVFLLLDAFLLSKNKNDPLFNSRDIYRVPDQFPPPPPPIKKKKKKKKKKIG